MATIALIVAGVLALLVAVLFGALAEMYRDIRQMRDAIGILDRPLPIDIGNVAHTSPRAHGLPRALDSAASALVLFLSDRCGTCRQLAAGLSRPLPDGLWLVLEARSEGSAASFLDRYGLSDEARNGRLVLDVAGDIATRIGLQTTPVAFRVENGLLIQATTVPSSRYLVSILPEPIRLREAG